MANNRLLLDTLKYIEDHPEEWNQAEWRCSTGACFAGHAAMGAGWQWEIRWSAVDSDRHERYKMFRAADPGNILSAEDAAIRELGIQRWQASKLFNLDNSLSDIRDIVYHLICGDHYDDESDSWT